MAEGAKTRKNELSAGVSRRRLLRLAGYAVPLAVAVNVGYAGRALAHSALACYGRGEGDEGNDGEEQGGDGCRDGDDLDGGQGATGLAPVQWTP